MRLPGFLAACLSSPPVRRSPLAPSFLLAVWRFGSLAASIRYEPTDPATEQGDCRARLISKIVVGAFFKFMLAQLGHKLILQVVLLCM